MKRKTREAEPKYVMISVVSERYGIHPQTLRLYEREGLLQPARSSGNTRLYDDRAIERLEMILTLTRDLGVNLAGVEVVLNLQERLDHLQLEVDRLLDLVKQQVEERRSGDRQFALVRLGRGALVPRR